MAQYYLIKGNDRLGPFNVEQLMSNGLMPDSLVWCEGMAGWTRAADVPELASTMAPPAPQPPAMPQPPVMPQQPAAPQPQPAAAPQPAAPAPPYSQSAPQYTNQQPYQQAQQPQQQPWNQQQFQPKPAVDKNVFKIILYVLLGLSGLGAVFTFFASFAYFGGWFNRPLLAIAQMLMSASIIGICVVSIMRMVKNEKYGFITIGYFAIAFILNLFGLIFVSGHGGYGPFSFFTGIAGLAIAVLASIPLEKVTDVNSYKELLNEAQPIDYALLGAYAVFSLITFIMVWSFLGKLRSYSL